MISGHRPDLDGLRTVAVYFVLLFHAGLSWFGGGYIGVDLFFCLSGFLVTSVLMTELQATGSLRVGRFYSRRVRRLLPAAVVVVIATCLTFPLLWSVVRRASIVGDAVSALLYYANFHFLASSGDYFAADIDKSPFLHFWSLSIEEQFYAVFPLLLLLLYRAGARHRRVVTLGVLALLLVVSLGGPDLVRGAQPGPRLLRHRHAALPAVRRGTADCDVRVHHTSARPSTAPTSWRSWASWASWSSPPGCSTGRRRGAASARPLASILVLAGLAQAEGSPLSRLLSLKPVAYLGRISYGTYLWHWPVILGLRTVLDAPGDRDRGAGLRHRDRPRGPVGRAAGAPDPALAEAGRFHLAGRGHGSDRERPGRRDDRADRARERSAAGAGVRHLRRVPLSSDPALTRATWTRAVPDLDYQSLAHQSGERQFCSSDDISACQVRARVGADGGPGGGQPGHDVRPGDEEAGARARLQPRRERPRRMPVAGGPEERQGGGRHGRRVRRRACGLVRRRPAPPSPRPGGAARPPARRHGGVGRQGLPTGRTAATTRAGGLGDHPRHARQGDRPWPRQWSSSG